MAHDTQSSESEYVSRDTAQKGDLALFLGQFVRKPTKIVALAPSSTGLSRKMTERLGPETGSVAELGSGTGKITDFILAQGVPEDRLALFEINETFSKTLQQKYPTAHVTRRSATEVDQAPLEDVGAVVSGLPLLSMPTRIQHEIVGGAFRLMRPGGIFVQFTYGYRPPVDKEVRDALGLDWSRSSKVWLNLPPARAYTFWQA